MWDVLILSLRAAPSFVIGFFVPGFLLCQLLLPSHHRGRWVVLIGSSFLLSLVLLAQLIFWCAVVGMPLRGAYLWPMMGVLIALLGAAAYRNGRKRDMGTLPAEPLVATPEYPKTLIVLAIIVGALLLWRSILWPLAGPDTAVRWDYLATRILRYDSINYYPPIRAEDFNYYFYVDGIPPTVAFSYWWLYEAVGRRVPQLTAFLVTAQLGVILIFVFALARTMDSARAGAFAVAAMISSSLVVWAIGIGQETGLTALGLVAMIYFLAEARSAGAEGWRWMILAGFAAALGALAREYGWAYLAIGVVAIVWMRLDWRMAAVFLGTAILLAAPWYVRNFIRTGNPLYNSRFAGLYVNSIHAGIMDSYRESMGISQWTVGDWIDVVGLLFKDGLIQMTVGLAAAMWMIRRWGFLLVACVIVTGLWLLSVGYTVGGWSYSMRVMSPVMALLSVSAGILLARVSMKGVAAYRVCAGVLIVVSVWGVMVAAFHPYTFSLSAWRSAPAIFVSTPPAVPNWTATVHEKLPAVTCVLTDNPYVAVSLEEHLIPVVPIWSPQVDFLLDESLPPLAARERLRAMGIRHIVAQNQLNLRYLVKRIRLYREDDKNWRLVHEVPGEAWILELPPAQAGM